MPDKIPTLVILIGIPGSGKSRWALKHPEYYRVCPDEIRREFFNDISDQSNNTSVWEVAKGMVIAALQLGHDTILDATNCSTSYRRRFYAGLPHHIRHAKIFEIYPDVAYYRINKDLSNELNRSNVPESVIYRMYGEYLYTVKAIEEEDFHQIEYIDQESF